MDYSPIQCPHTPPKHPQLVTHSGGRRGVWGEEGAARMRGGVQVSGLSEEPPEAPRGLSASFKGKPPCSETLSCRLQIGNVWLTGHWIWMLSTLWIFASGQKCQMPPLDPQVYPKAGEQIQPGNPCQYERPPGVSFPLRHPAAVVVVWVIPLQV